MILCDRSSGRYCDVWRDLLSDVPASRPAGLSCGCEAMFMCLYADLQADSSVTG